MTIGTIQVERSQWQWVDVYIQDAAGAPVTGLTSANFTVRYKKNNQITFTTKTLGSTTALLTATAAAGSTTLTVDDLSAFKLDSQVTINPGGGTEETIDYTIIPGLATSMTLDTATANIHSSGETLRLVDFVEVGVGVYTFLFSDDELDTVGQFTAVFTPTSGLQVVREIDVVYRDSAGSAPPTSPQICRVYGYVLDSEGAPKENVGVSAAPLALPNTVSNMGINRDTVAVKTDVNGYFSISLIQAATVDFSIPEVNYRRTILVPSTDSANLFEIAAS